MSSYSTLLTQEQYNAYLSRVQMVTIDVEKSAVQTTDYTVMFFDAFEEIQKQNNKKHANIQFTFHQTLNECVKIFMMNHYTKVNPDDTMDYIMVAGYCLLENDRIANKNSK